MYPNNLRSHIESKHYSPGYKCQFCGRLFKIMKSCRWHEKKFHLPSFLDHLSNGLYSSIQTRLESLIQKQGTQSWCSACGYTSRTQIDVERHVEARHLQLELHCHFCIKIFTTRLNLQRHMRKHHTQDQDQLRELMKLHT
eukprot:11683.XXX_701324_705092_1 [CDS] Oithona nana genome sequencing.